MPARRLTDAEREERRTRDRERLERAARELLSTDGWRRWVAVRSKNGLGRYSLNNQLLISLEMWRRGCAPRFVAGYRWWSDHGYQVRRGERAIRILAPIRRKLADAESGEESLVAVGFRGVSVFDLSQVEAGPDAVELAPPSEPIHGNSHEPHLAALEQLSSELGCKLQYREPEVSGAGGHYDRATGEIVVDASIAANARVRVLLHELGHAIVDREMDLDLSYAEEECVVEAAGHIAAAFVGLDTSGEAVSYVAGWGEDSELDVVRRAAESVDAVARRLENALATAEP